MNSMVARIKDCYKKIKESRKQNVYIPTYRLVNILENEDGDYSVTIQAINTHIAFNIQPEEILADDKITGQFSPHDIRTITYLGYLGINNPKYKILAKRFFDNEKIVFALKKNGEDTVITKTAEQIFSEKEIINHMSVDDTKEICHIVAIEGMQHEKNIIQKPNNK